ncbi:MAG: hypothetical protein L3J02_01090 [Henriciella sp.]|nr:hypothetical protein [Henriciella sp.]
MSGEVETWFDKPPNGDDPGFGIRLRSAYLNEISPTLPSWSGFTVLAGLTDVPLFNDTRLAGQFDNRDIDDPSSYDLFVFQDETDNDGGGPTPRDGVPDNYQLDVPDYRALLRPDNPHPPSPYFEYSWPTSSMVDLNYYAQYTRASGEDMPLFNGIRKDSDIMKVIQVHSVPDYINPQKTKFSFGASADLAEMQKNFQIDPGNITGSVDTFLHNVLHVPDSFSLDSVFCPTGVCLHDLEDNMRDMTGGDLLVPMGKSLDTLLQQPPLDSVIRDVSRTLTLAHQAPAQVSGILLQPMRDTRNALLGRISTQMTGSFSELYSSAYLAALAVYDNDQLLAISTGRPTDEQISAMLISVNAFRTSIDQLINRLDSGVIQYTSAVESLTRPVDGAITTLLGATQSAREALSGLGDALDQNLSGLASPDPQVNPLLGKVDEARQNITQIRNVIAAIDFGPLGTVLQQAAALSGASIDTSLIDAARQTIDSALAELDGVIAQADAALQAAYGSLPLSGILSGVHDLIKDGPTDNLYGRLKTLAASLQAIQTRIRQIDPLVRNDLNTLQGQLAALRQAVASSQPINSSITSWSDVQSAAQIALDTTAGTIFNVQNQNFATLFESKFSGLIGQPFTTLLEDTAAGGLAELLDTSITAVTAGLPQPSENDIRNMIRIGVLNTNPVDQGNQGFFSQFGLLSDQLDTISTAMTDRMNELIRQTVDAVNQSMSDQLAGSKLPIGGGDWGLRSVGIDGYALVSQDEFERIHMGAEFVFGQDPDPTSYNAALDVTSWKADNGKTGCVADPGNYFDVTISTHDVTADMLGMDVGIKTAMLGFTINSNSGPVGVLGNCYLAGNINFEVLVLEDLGLEVGVGAQETYFGATGAGRFQEYRIPKAAFFVGRSCDFAVLERLDPEIAEFIGPLPKLEGIYARGSVSVPIYNGGCWFTVGAGVDVGAWYFADPSPGTYGGLFGGSAYGSLGCLASIKGMLRCIGQKSGGDYKFNGSGWAGAGTGFCSPGSWQNVGDVRGDSWCLTGDASFTATYLMNDGVSGDLSITGPDVHCCD